MGASIGANFFPSANPTSQLLSSFAVFGLTFLARPLGGLFFGPLADRLGRKRVLVVVVTMMAASTTAIGLLPTFATIGVAAPVLLVTLRLVQGFSAGGEYGSASTFMAEYAATGRRAFATSRMMFSTIAGFIAGSLPAGGLAVALGPESMAAWGWRIPFLVAGPLGIVALYIRLRLEDTPEFLACAGNCPERHCGRRSATTARLCSSPGSARSTPRPFYLVFTYMATYLGSVVGLGADVVLTSTLVAGGAALLVLPLVGTLADRVGRRPVLLSAAAGFAVLAYPLFLLISSGTAVAAVVGHVALAVLLACFILLRP